jgi:hypothetical protein
MQVWPRFFYKTENEMKEIETYAVYQRQIALSRDALEAIPCPI